MATDLGASASTSTASAPPKPQSAASRSLERFQIDAEVGTQLISQLYNELQGYWVRDADPWGPPPSDFPTKVADADALVGRLQDALLALQLHHSHRPDEDIEGRCPICLLDYEAAESDRLPRGKANRHKRRKFNARLARMARPFMNLDKEQTVAIIARCGHILHYTCWQRFRAAAKSDFRAVTCPMCRGPADSTLAADVVPNSGYMHFLWVAVSTLRMLTSCQQVSRGQVCPAQASCRFCHLAGGQLVQQGPPPPPPQEAFPYAAPVDLSQEEMWEEEEVLHVPPPPITHRHMLTRSGRVPRGPGDRGSGRVPVWDYLTNGFTRVMPDVAQTEVMADGQLRYERNLSLFRD